MEPIRRKFRSEVSASSINKLLEKRQRRRSHNPNREPYNIDQQVIKKVANRNKLGDTTVIESIPQSMNPKFKHLTAQTKMREIEKPEHWILPKKEVKASQVDKKKAERESISKILDLSASWSRGARCLIKANCTKVSKPASNITAKGYLSNRIDNMS